MSKKLAFFSKGSKRSCSHEEFLNSAAEIIRQCRLLISSVEDVEIKSKLKDIIENSLKIISAVKDKREDAAKELFYELTKTSLLLPSEISAQNRLGSFSSILANFCLFVVVLSLATFSGYLFYASFYAASSQAILAAFVNTCAFDVIPFGIVGLFANYIAHSVNDKNASAEALQAAINEFCQPTVVDLQIDAEDDSLRAGEHALSRSS